MKSLYVALAISFAAGTAVALAAERTISQKGKVFSEASVAVKRAILWSF